MMTLFGYWRSSASYRVRIALALKGVEFNYVPVNLREGAQKQGEHLTRNPQGFVPVLEMEDGTQLTQSLAIMDYLDGAYPKPALLPDDAVLRSKILAASLVIASDISPIQNLSVLNYIRAEHGQGDDGVKEWAAHWIKTGFESLERMGRPKAKFFLTDIPTMFECCLIPQIYNAHRFGVDMAAFPNLSRIDEACLARPDFAHAHPDNQIDKPKL